MPTRTEMSRGPGCHLNAPMHRVKAASIRGLTGHSRLLGRPAVDILSNVMRATLAARLIWPFLVEPQVAPLACKILAKSGLRPEDLDVPGARVDHDLLVDLVELAVRVTGNERLGLLGATLLGTGMFQILDHISRASATVLEGLQMVARYNRILHDGFRFEVELQEDYWAVRLGVEAGLRFPPALAEFCMANLYLGAYRMGLPAGQSKVFFAHPEPNDVRPFAEVFRVPVYFGATENYALLSVDSVQRRLPYGDPVLRTLLEGHAEEMLARISNTSQCAALTRRLLAGLLHSGEPSLSRVAHELHLSPRTLRRRLMNEGTTFQRVLDDLRKDLALSHLQRRSLAIDEVAFLLGFSEASAFRRAFKRWTGQSLVDYKRS
jgi:AraC-like DNA-binding protein